jgi:hypothetical protein
VKGWRSSCSSSPGAGRFCSSDDLNPDESQLIAGAIALTHDPVFWRSVDGTTSGPLNYYVLLPLHWLGLPLDYFSARLTGLLLVAGALWAGLRALAHVHGRTAAWVGLLPAAAFFATATHPDLIHYSSEHAPLLLVAAAASLLVTRTPGDRTRLHTALFIAGAAPWAKLQAAPLSLVLIGWAAWQIWFAPAATTAKRWRALAAAALAATGPTLIFVTLAGLTGQLELTVRRYFLHNLIYVGESTRSSLAEVLREITRLALLDGRVPWLLLSLTAVLLVALGVLIARKARLPAPLALGAWLTLAAVLAVLAPRREYLHYVLFLPWPATLLTGAAVGGWWRELASARARRTWLIALLVVGGGPLLVTRCVQPVPNIYGDFSYQWQHPRSSVAAVVHGLAGQNATLGVWGWANFLYVETGLRQATRDTHSTWSIFGNAQREHHRAIYLADLQASRPEIFVDATGPGSFVFNDRATQGHETFPALAEYIREHYALVTDLTEARVYARRDLPVLQSLTPDRLDQLISLGRLKTRHAEPVPAPVRWPDPPTLKIVERRQVLMVLPPTRLEWTLERDVRRITFSYGFDPVAHLQGNSDGAELVLEIVRDKEVQPLLRRTLDPAHQPADHGLQTSTLLLPPLPPGARLVLRTDAGPKGNNAWDWLYVAGLEFERHPTFLPEQFPGFDPLPVEADSLHCSPYIGEDGVARVLLHAPGSLGFALSPDHQRLQLDYGLQPGSYREGGNTDGADFWVELARPGEPRQLLFTRHLDPVSHPEDRGDQHLDLPLPASPAGSRLLIRIDPGPAGNAAWDWTYLSGLKLR